MKKELLFVELLISVLLMSFASAVTFQKTAVNDVIIPEFNQPANFLLTLDDVDAGLYHFYTLTDVALKPEGDLTLKNGENKFDFSVYAQERLKTYSGGYTFVYGLKSNTNSGDYEDRMTVRVIPLKDAIEISSDTINPDTDKITFYIQNMERAKLENVTAKFVSIFFNEQRTFDINPLEKTEITIPINQDEAKKIKAGVYLINAEFNTDSGKKSVEGKLYWAEKEGITTQESVQGFFIKSIKSTKLNIGNVPQTVSITIRKNIITRLFTSFNVKPSSVRNDGLGVIYTWNKELGPAQSLIVNAKTNYFYPLLIILLAIIIIYAYIKYTEKKVEVLKSVSHVKTKGGEFALKVRILVKAKKAIQGVSLVDKMPAMTKIYDKLWTVEPKKIDTLNRRIYWDIGDMGAGEERAFSYVVYSKIGVIGKFGLPEALVILEKDGKIHEITSNQVFFLSEQARRND